ncbi:unnamed protein product, partial [Ectocarpus sp. 6 AP-2014]
TNRRRRLSNLNPPQVPGTTAIVPPPSLCSRAVHRESNSTTDSNKQEKATQPASVTISRDPVGGRTIFGDGRIAGAWPNRNRSSCHVRRMYWGK